MPFVVPGIFMRCSVTRESTSCRGKMAVSAGEESARRIKIPCRIGAVHVQIAAVVILFLLCCRLIPAVCGVIIMRLRYRQRYFIVAMGQIGVVFSCPSQTAKSASGESCKVAQGGSLICNDAQILRDEGERRAELFFQQGKKCFAGAEAHLPPRASSAPNATSQQAEKPWKWSMRRDIDILQILLDTGKPPRKACFFVLPPSIVRIAPKLSRFAEIIGRHAGDAGREALAVQTKELQMRPDICCRRNENEASPMTEMPFSLA